MNASVEFTALAAENDLRETVLAGVAVPFAVIAGSGTECRALHSVKGSGLSCWAREAIIVKRTSPLESIVLIASFSKKTGIFSSLSSRMYFRQSSVFRAKRLIYLVIIMSMFPAWHSSIMRLNSSRFLVLVPVMPSSK